MEAVVIMLHEGAKLYVQEKVDNWKKVQLTDVQKDGLKVTLLGK
jgi:hypothetical protein